MRLRLVQSVPYYHSVTVFHIHVPTCREYAIYITDILWHLWFTVTLVIYCDTCDLLWHLWFTVTLVIWSCRVTDFMLGWLSHLCYYRYFRLKLKWVVSPILVSSLVVITAALCVVSSVLSVNVSCVNGYLVPADFCSNYWYRWTIYCNQYTLQKICIFRIFSQLRSQNHVPSTCM